MITPAFAIFEDYLCSNEGVVVSGGEKTLLSDNSVELWTLCKANIQSQNLALKILGAMCKMFKFNVILLIGLAVIYETDAGHPPLILQ